MLASPDQQVSLTDPDSRLMATSGRGSGVVGYNVREAEEIEHHLIVTHEVTNSGSDRAQLTNIASQAKDVLEAIADRGYFSGEQILACDQSGISVTLPKPITSGIETKGPFSASRTLSISVTRMSITVRLELWDRSPCWETRGSLPSRKAAMARLWYTTATPSAPVTCCERVRPGHRAPG